MLQVIEENTNFNNTIKDTACGISILLNNKIIKGGKEEDNIWCEIPVDKYNFSIIAEDIYKVKLDI